MKNIFFLLAFLPFALFAQIRADQLPEITDPNGNDAIYTAERGSFEKIKLSSLADFFSSGGGVDTMIVSNDTLYLYTTTDTFFAVIPAGSTDAVDIIVADAGANFVTDNVEAALLELVTNQGIIDQRSANNADSVSVLRTDLDAISGGAGDGVATAGAYDAATQVIDVTVAAPGSNFAIDVSDLTKQMFEVYNATGATLTKGTVVYPTGTSTGGVSNVQKAIANSHETIKGPIGVIAADVLNNAAGEVIVVGVIETNTVGLSLGEVYLSTATAGTLTSTRPEFPDYAVSVGIVDVIGASGQISIDNNFSVRNTVASAFDGVARESFNFTTSSDGVTVTGTLENADPTRDLTLIFSEGFYTFDCTPAATIALTPGTDANTQTNFVYIPDATKALTVSTMGFPDAEHVKIAMLEVQSAANVQSVGGVRKNQNINDHLKTTDDNGHISHVTEWIRRQFASWGGSGCEATFDDTGGNGYIDRKSVV